MNRKQKRRLIAKPNLYERVKSFADLYALFHSKGIEIPAIKDGDKIKLNLESIRSHPDYPSLSAKYTQFVENNADTVFTAKVEHGGYIDGMISLQEDQTGWLFWAGDLLKLS